MLRGSLRVNKQAKAKDVEPRVHTLSSDQLEAFRARQQKRWGISRMYTERDSYKGFQSAARLGSVDVTDKDVAHDVSFDIYHTLYFSQKLSLSFFLLLIGRLLHSISSHSPREGHFAQQG